MTPKSRDYMPTTSLWGVSAKWPTRAPKTKLTLPERPTRIQPYQFEAVRQDFEGVPEHRVSFEAKPHAVFYGVCEIALTEVLATEVLATQMGVIRRSKKISSFELIHFRLTAGRLRGSSCIVIPGVVCELLQFAATQLAGIVNFFVDHTHTHFTEESKMATELTPQTDVTSGETYRK